MRLQLLGLKDEPIYTVLAQLSLYWAIANILTKVKHALILSNIFDFLLQVAQLMQTYFKVIYKIAHWVVQRVQIIYIFVIDLITFNLLHVLRVLFLPLAQYFLILHDLALKYLYVLLERLHLQQALLCLIQVDIFVYIRDNTDLALAGGKNCSVCPSSPGWTVATYWETSSILNNVVHTICALVINCLPILLCRHSCAIASPTCWRRWHLKLRRAAGTAVLCCRPS